MRESYFSKLFTIFALFLTVSASAAPIAEYHLNEFFWDSSADEVKDSSGNDYHGSVLTGVTPSVSYPVTNSNPGSCGYASMSPGSIAVTGLPVSTLTNDKTTVSFWMNWDGGSSVMPIGWKVYDLYITSSSFGFNSGAGDIYGIPSSGLVNGWHHVSAEFTNGDIHSNRLVIDGVEQVLTQLSGAPRNSTAVVQSELRIGGWSHNTNYKFSGAIDEIRVHNGTLSIPEVQAIMTESQPCSIKEPIGDWHFDELNWFGNSQEVKDSSFNNYDSDASAGTTTTEVGQLCRAADFTADGISDFVTLNSAVLDGLNDFTVSLWATLPNSPSALISGAGSSTNNELLMFKASATTINLYIHNQYRKFTVPNLEDGGWHHLVWTRTGFTHCLYVDDSFEQCVSTYTKSSPLNIQGLIVGQEQDSVLGRFDNDQEHEGLIDEISIYNRVLTAQEISEINSNITAGENIDGSVRHCPGTPVTEWRFDEPFWNGVTSEVIDSSVNNLHGKAIANAITDATTPALPGGTGTCSYGVFDGSAGNNTDQHIQLPNDARLNEISDALTITAWINVSEEGPYNYIISNDRDCCGAHKGFSIRVRENNVPEFLIWDDSGGMHSVPGPNLNLSQWYHLGATFDGKELKLYVDGVLVGTSFYTGKIGTAASFDTVLAGLGYNPRAYNLKGLLDEVRIYDVALDQTAIQGIMNEVRTCFGSCDISDDYLLFEDDFDDGDFSGWDVHRFNGKGCGWLVESGQLKEQRNSCSGFLGHSLKTSDKQLTGYVIKADVDARPTGGNNGVGLVFGYIDDSNYYIVRWRDYGSAYTSNSTHRDFELLKISGGVTTVLDRKTQLDLPDSFEISVDVNSTNGIKVSIDCDQQILGLQASGEFPQIQEFGVYTHDNDSAVYYDNVRVYGKTIQPPAPLALFHLDGSNWSGSPNEVIDSSGNNYHGQTTANTSSANVSPVKNSDPGTCGYASQSAGSILVQNLPVSLAHGDKTTVSFWMNWDGTSGVMPIGWQSYDLYLSSGSFGFNSAAGDIYGVTSSGLANGWHHVSAEFTNGNLTDNRLVIDGVERTLSQLSNFPSNSRAVVGTQLQIGGWGASSGYRFTGSIDELRIDNGSLTVEQVQAIMNQTHPCSGTSIDHFKISHDGAGIHCSDETVIVTVIDGNGNTFESYTGTITLDTQSGSGDWVATTGYGILNDASADDGLATYTFTSADKGSASFTLRYETGPATFNIDVYDGGIRDDDSEDDFTYAASGFILTANPISNPPPVTINDPIQTQISDSSFPVYITAYGQSATHPECGVIEHYTGDKSIRFQGEYINPSTGTRNIEINGSGITMGALDSARTITFAEGKAQVTANYTDVGSIRVRAYDTSGADVIYAISNTFVVKPSGFKFEVTRSSDNAVNPSAADANGNIFVAAGADFDVLVSAVNSNGDTTPNYGNESPAESINMAHSLVAPVGGVQGTLLGSLSAQGAGVFRGTFNWNEVGIIQLSAEVLDKSYLGAGNTSTDSNNVGRFTPEYFEIFNKQDGALDLGCEIITGTSGFNYIGKEFGYQLGNNPEFEIVAKNLAGNTTSNYEGSFAKLTTVGVSIPVVTQDASNSLPITQQQDLATLTSFSKGLSTYTFGDDLFTYDRNTPSGMFNSDIDLVIDSITDSDGVTDNFTLAETLQPSAVELRYGRLIINSAFGSELIDLVLPIKLQVYDDTVGDFITDTDNIANHSCAAFTVSPLEMIDSLSPALVSTSLSTLVSGKAALTLSAPGAGNIGTLGVTLDAPTWLEFDWGKPLTEPNRLDPKATATFGINSGNDAIIYQREIR